MPSFKGNATVKMTGDVARFNKLFGSKAKIDKLWKKIKLKALKRTTLFFEGKIKKNIFTSGTLAGKPFAPNSPVTIKIKKSTKPLINSADMMGSVHPVIPNENVGFVGLKRGNSHNSGEDLADIAEDAEYGTLTKNGFEVPARPFIGPVKEKFSKEAAKVFSKVVEDGLN
jgi:hypothetical protein